MATDDLDPAQRVVRVLTYVEAREILDAGLAEATRIGVPATVAVIDASREVIALARQDRAPILTGEVAVAKAFTSFSLRQPSADLEPHVAPGGAFFGLHSVSTRAIVTFGGGLPLFDGDDVIGAVGASGGSVDEDLAIVGAAVAAFRKTRQ